MVNDIHTSELPPVIEEEISEDGAPVALALVFLGSITMFAGTFCWLLFF